MKQMKSMRFGLLLASALATTPAFAQGDATPITIGVPVGLSGANSVVAPAVVQATELAVDQINAAGGILGRPVKIAVADDASGAAGAQTAYNTLVFQDDVDVVITMETSAARNAGIPIVEEGEKPFIYSSFYEGRSCSPNMFVNGWVPEQQVPPVVEKLLADGAKNFFLIGSDYAFGRGMLEFSRKYIEEKGGKIVGEEYLPMDGSDWTAILSNLRSAGADAVITSTAGGTPNVTLTKQLRASGISIPYANLAVDEGTAKAMGADAAGILISASYLTAIDTPENKDFMAALQKKFGAEMRTPNDLSTPQYEAVYLYKAAVEKAGSTKTEDVLAALPQVSFKGPRGEVSMSKQHHAPLTMYLGEVQADGSVKVVADFPNVDPGEQCPDL
ncbi:substrate-binding protein [Paracoccus sulfuroxidans]|uniref:Amino acid/amide ABC transporter substrate-binding protein, HAAT family (TC 3.A.1.4.-) n=1 Tax=Paracoccus sulfuroxidans TaxID=384678 RepID=A0A562NGK0_9RHOB|nr:substrate-binding protein [Paracoccus sulfuroxidans]TWI31224.1 amino acid/amide ABC transporter substrate-binding protein, HAAT family (TC 3.A.1.4.-) [Paracoccus sulfuroxidans]